MTKRIVRRDRARADIVDIYAFIAADNPAAADRFLEAVDETIERQIARHPSSGVKRGYGRASLADFRMLAVSGFPHYLVFYRIDDDAIRVIRVLHGARDIPNVLDPAE